MSLLLPLIVLVGTMTVACGANAATWMATMGTVGSSAYTHGGATFTDGAYNVETDQAATTDKLLVGAIYPNGVPNTSLNFIDLRGLDPLTQPPRVDLVNMRADFSSLFITGWFESGTGAIGWDLGRNGWTPILANGNGSYTATWLAPPPRNGQPFSSGLITFTFAPAVPEPSTTLLLALALPGLWLTMRWRTRQSTASR